MEKHENLAQSEQNKASEINVREIELYELPDEELKISSICMETWNHYIHS